MPDFYQGQTEQMGDIMQRLRNVHSSLRCDYQQHRQEEMKVAPIGANMSFAELPSIVNPLANHVGNTRHITDRGAGLRIINRYV